MSESATNFQEKKKPIPVSTGEYFSMDTNTQRTFFSGLTTKEKTIFQLVAMREYEQMPLSQRIDRQKKQIASLIVKENKTISDKLSLWQAKQHLKYLERNDPPPRYPKWIRDLKSPYLIAR